MGSLESIFKAENLILYLHSKMFVKILWGIAIESIISYFAFEKNINIYLLDICTY